MLPVGLNTTGLMMESMEQTQAVSFLSGKPPKSIVVGFDALFDNWESSTLIGLGRRKGKQQGTKLLTCQNDSVTPSVIEDANMLGTRFSDLPLMW